MKELAGIIGVKQENRRSVKQKLWGVRKLYSQINSIHE